MDCTIVWEVSSDKFRNKFVQVQNLTENIELEIEVKFKHQIQIQSKSMVEFSQIWAKIRYFKQKTLFLDQWKFHLGLNSALNRSNLIKFYHGNRILQSNLAFQIRKIKIRMNSYKFVRASWKLKLRFTIFQSEPGCECNSCSKEDLIYGISSVGLSGPKLVH